MAFRLPIEAAEPTQEAASALLFARALATMAVMRDQTTHPFGGRICLNCGSSETAIGQFGWRCSGGRQHAFVGKPQIVEKPTKTKASHPPGTYWCRNCNDWVRADFSRVSRPVGGALIHSGPLNVFRVISTFEGQNTCPRCGSRCFLSTKESAELDTKRQRQAEFRASYPRIGAFAYNYPWGEWGLLLAIAGGIGLVVNLVTGWPLWITVGAAFIVALWWAYSD